MRLLTLLFQTRCFPGHIPHPQTQRAATTGDSHTVPGTHIRRRTDVRSPRQLCIAVADVQSPAQMCNVCHAHQYRRAVPDTHMCGDEHTRATPRPFSSTDQQEHTQHPHAGAAPATLRTRARTAPRVRAYTHTGGVASAPLINERRGHAPQCPPNPRRRTGRGGRGHSGRSAQWEGVAPLAHAEGVAIQRCGRGGVAPRPRPPRPRAAGQGAMGPGWRAASAALVAGSVLIFAALRRLALALPQPAAVRSRPGRVWRWRNLLVSFAHSVLAGLWALFRYRAARGYGARCTRCELGTPEEWAGGRGSRVPRPGT